VLAGALESLSQTSPYERRILEDSYENLWRIFEPDSLRALLEGELGGVDVIDHWRPMRGGARQVGPPAGVSDKAYPCPGGERAGSRGQHGRARRVDEGRPSSQDAVQRPAFQVWGTARRRFAGASSQRRRRAPEDQSSRSFCDSRQPWRNPPDDPT
jgi:hypothetical protein